jgi:transcription elongation factor GreA
VEGFAGIVNLVAHRYDGGMADQVQHLSQAAYDRLKAEHEDLTTRGRIEIAKKIQAARELGDLSENGDYHAAKEEQGKMEGRIAHLAAVLLDVVIVEADGSGSTVQHGTVVSICYEGDDEHETYLIGSIEERHEDHEVISPTSPLGSSLIGAAVGETVSFAAPAGELKVTIVEIHS